MYEMAKKQKPTLTHNAKTFFVRAYAKAPKQIITRLKAKFMAITRSKTVAFRSASNVMDT